MTKIIDIQIWEASMPLIEPYTIAYETIHAATNVFLEIKTDTGLRGYGCAAPDLEVTGETAASVIALFNKKAEPRLHRQSPFQIARIMAGLKEDCPHSPSLLAMVDMALHDLLAKKAALPLYQLLGGFQHSIPTSITIGILPVEETLEKAMQYKRQGFNILKIKGGLNVGLDIERIARIRAQLGKNMRLRFDANQGYDFDETIQFVKATRPYAIEILEQPTPRTELEVLGAVAEHSHLPVMADESLLSLLDAFKLAKNGWADMVNIKLMKVGGITQAMHINSVAKAAGMEAMVGCMDESALGIAAGLHFALARPNVEFADLDGHLDLLEDPASACITIKEGVLYPSLQPGLGLKYFS